MKVTTWNVNGIRAAQRKGFNEWVAAEAPDVLLLQETRAPADLVAEIVGEGYTTHCFPCEIKGRAGVAIAVKNTLEATGWYEDPGTAPVDTGRWLEVTVNGVRFVSAYLHSGEVASEEKMAAKYAHLSYIKDRFAQLLTASRAGEGEALVCGDYNIVHTELDIKNWKSNHNKTAGVLDEEIAYLDEWMGDGWVDTHRQILGPSERCYTWWSQRGNAFTNDVGWRIDYQLATPGLAQRATSATVGRAASYAERISDHAPLTVIYADTP